MLRNKTDWNGPMENRLHFVWMCCCWLSLPSCLIGNDVVAQEAASVENRPLPSPYHCLHATDPIELDGKLDEPAWRNAQRIDHFNVLRPADAEYSYQTAGYLTWDDQNLYVAFDCEDVDVVAATTGHDSYLAVADVVELYVKYDNDHPQYYEFIWAPNGTTFDARWPERGAGDFRQFTPWESNFKAAVSVRGTLNLQDDVDEGFTVECAIPWSAFDGVQTPPSDGTAWTFGLFRYDHGSRFKQPYLLMSIPEAAGHGFHAYEFYQSLVFSR